MSGQDDATKKPGLGFKLNVKAGLRRGATGGSGKAAQNDADRQVIRGLDGGTVISEDGAPARPKGELVIPKIENTFQVGVGRQVAPPGAAAARQAGSKVPSFVPEASNAGATTGERFETAAEEQRAAVAYGLETRRREPAAGAADDADGGGEGAAQPLSTRLRGQADLRRLEDAAYREDMERLPDGPDLGAYEAVPVEHFAMAMLRGMGWKEGMNVGRNQAGKVQAVKYVARPPRLGLGAQPAETKREKAFIKPGEKRGPQEQLVALNEHGAVKNVVGLDEKLARRPVKGPAVGKAMEVVEGRHAGLRCEVRELVKEAGRSDRARVRLTASGAEVVVRCSELGELGEGEARRRRERERAGRERAGERSAKRARAEEDRGARDAGWVMPGIRVRVVDRHVGGGKLYLQKGVIVDVTRPRVCDVRMEHNGTVVSDVRQASLETVVPKAAGGRVMVLRGAFRGQVGSMLARAMSDGHGAAAVQVGDDAEVLRVSLDDVAEVA
ncbi:unnamed protein product [Pedinophyceae sp. YPF-701]|nr:unnamed protein product [Pedinophyceae sp. YPF-701]